MERTLVNLNNFTDVSISDIRRENKKGEKYTDSHGNPFYFYWVTFWQGSTTMVACTGSEFTKLLGDKAGKNDNLLADLIIDHQDEFEVTQATDEDDKPIFYESGEPMLKIQRAPHKVSLAERAAARKARG